jgi:ABC-type phosphate transport system substrate-binding protein
MFFWQSPNLKMLPVAAAAVLPVYHISTLSATDPPLNLTREVLVSIFNGTITTWSDPSIADINPLIASKLPNSRISKIIRGDKSGTTGIFTDALSLFGGWKYGLVSNWPQDLNQTLDFIPFAGNFGVLQGVIETEDSIGYVAQPFALLGGVQGVVNPALLLIDKSQKPISSRKDSEDLDSFLNFI